MHFSSLYFTRFGGVQGSSSWQSFPASGLDHLQQSLSTRGLSADVVSSIVRDVEPATVGKYQLYWSKFTSWCEEREVNSGNLSVNNVCKFMIYMFNSGLSASTLRFVKSAIYFFLCESHGNIVEHSHVSRIMKSFEKQRPTVPRYAVTWDVNKVLCFLRSRYPHNSIILKQ